MYAPRHDVTDRLSFASRLTLEPEAEKTLKAMGDVELRKLEIVPQTVFLKSRSLDFPTHRLSRIHSLQLQRSGLGTPLISPIRPTRVSTADIHITAGAPFEDLRRRLATINGSASSLALSHTSPPRDHRGSISPVPVASISSRPQFPSTLERPSSPTESVISASNSLTFRPTSRLQIGSIDGRKAAPAVGSSKMNATGLLDAHSSLLSERSPERSGRSSPMSMSTTIRGPLRSRVPSLLPISTYGMVLFFWSFSPLNPDVHTDGQDPGISNLLENLYLDNNRELQNDFGPRVHEGPVRRRNAVRHTFGARDGVHKRAGATLVAHLTSHSDSITALAVAPDHMFFVSASDDKTIKIWDTARLERNVTSKPRLTYGQHHAQVKCVCMLEGVHCFASAADDGSLHVVRVHTTQSGSLPKYNKLQVIREHRVKDVGEYITCMAHFNTGRLHMPIFHSCRALISLKTRHQTLYMPLHILSSQFWIYGR